MKKIAATLISLLLAFVLSTGAIAEALGDLTDEDIALLGLYFGLAAAYEEAQNSSNNTSNKRKERNYEVEYTRYTESEVPAYYANVETNGGELNVRVRANKGATIKKKLKNGTQLLVIGTTSNGWYKVRAGNVTGYVPSRYVSGSADSANYYFDESNIFNEYYAVVNPTNNFVNMRSAPNMSARVIAVYYYGQKLLVVSESGSWCEVYDEETGRTGYMKKELLLYNGDAAGGNG